MAKETQKVVMRAPKHSIKDTNTQLLAALVREDLKATGWVLSPRDISIMEMAVIATLNHIELPR